MTKEAKMQIVIDNYFKSECDVNTSIRKAFEKGFRIGVQKGSVDADPVKHGHWVEQEHEDWKWSKEYRCSECGKYRLVTTPVGREWNYCPNCGAHMEVETE